MCGQCRHADAVVAVLEMDAIDALTPLWVIPPEVPAVLGPPVHDAVLLR